MKNSFLIKNLLNKNMDAMYKHLMIRKRLSSATQPHKPVRDDSERSITKKNNKKIRVSVGSVKLTGLGVSGRHLLNRRRTESMKIDG